MKKILAIIMAIFMVATVLCVPAFAVESADGFVLTVSAIKKDGTTIVKIADYTSFEAGWNFAMDKAKNQEYLDTNAYDRIVVDLLTDWEANAKGEFGDSDGLGFQWSTIYVPENTAITINLNGLTINRGLRGSNELDGEVIFVGEEANLIINNGTITGGNSDNGAGGIHIERTRLDFHCSCLLNLSVFFFASSLAALRRCSS